MPKIKDLRRALKGYDDDLDLVFTENEADLTGEEFVTMVQLFEEAVDVAEIMAGAEDA